MWAETAWDSISDILTNAFLKSSQKKNLRQLTKAEVSTLEQLKIDILTNLPIMCEVNESVITHLLFANCKTPSSFSSALKSNNISLDEMTIDAYRKNVVGFYIEQNLP